MEPQWDDMKVFLAVAREASLSGAAEDDGLLVLEVGNSYPALIEAYPDLPFIWPEFERGGHGICVLHSRDLKQL